MLPFENNFTSIAKNKIKQVVGGFTITGTGTDTYAVSLSSITGNRITDNSYIIAVSLFTYSTNAIAIGTRLSATSGNLVVLFNSNVSNNTQIQMRYNITYYTD